jgi:hypothetical protein
MTYELEITLAGRLLFKVTCLETIAVATKVRDELKDRFGDAIDIYQVDVSRIKIAN